MYTGGDVANKKGRMAVLVIKGKREVPPDWSDSAAIVFVACGVAQLIRNADDASPAMMQAEEEFKNYFPQE